MGTVWVPANKGRRVRITAPSHPRFGLTGRITNGWNAVTGACWVRIDGQGLETVVAPWQWECLG